FQWALPGGFPGADCWCLPGGAGCAVAPLRTRVSWRRDDWNPDKIGGRRVGTYDHACAVHRAGAVERRAVHPPAVRAVLGGESRGLAAAVRADGGSLAPVCK